MLTEHKRVKHGHLPGEINRGYLIAMLENRHGEYEIEVFLGSTSPSATLAASAGSSARRAAPSSASATGG